MKDLIHQYADYDVWATKRLLVRFSGDDDPLLDTPASSSFPTIRATLLHMRDAAHVWYSRLMVQPHRWPAEESRAMPTIMAHLIKLHAHVSALKEEDMGAICRYADLSNNAYEQPAWHMIMHCYNHATFHRGQVVSQMRTLGMEDLPRTDLIAYQRTLL